jgi:IS5 family transposase
MNKFDKFGFADIEIENRFKEPTYLDKISSLVNWKRIENILNKHYKKNKDAVGNPAYPAINMFKILLVQRWEKLSDPQMEFALRDRISVIRFVGFPLSSPTPDHSTICRFRNELLKTGTFEVLLNEINFQLSSLGFMVKEKSSAVIDATIVSSHSRPRKTLDIIPEDRKEEDSSDESSANISFSADPDAAWLKKGKKSYFGYKQFLGTDEKGFILSCLTKPANVSEMNTLPEFIERLDLQPGSMLYGDKGYASNENRVLLAENGIKDFIMHKKTKGSELSGFQKKVNRFISGVRYVVEQTFGILKQHFGIDKARYIGIKKVQMEFELTAIAYNLKKAANMLY